MRLLAFLAIGLLFAFGAPFSVRSQSLTEPSTYTGTPDSELMLQWLHSPDPRLQAWAAHDILEYRSTGLIPDLESQLERTTPATLSGDARVASFRTTLAILDTLIQLDAKVPAATITRIEKLGYNAQTEELVLLCRLPWEEAEPAIRSFYQPGSSGNAAATRVAAQLLAQHPPKGFAAELLSTIQVTARILVHDPNGGGGGIGSGSSSCCGAGSGAMDDDWPEIGRSSFLDPHPRGQPLPKDATLFLPAPDPVYVHRSVSRYYYASGCAGLTPLNDAIRSHLVRTMLKGDTASPFPEQPVYLDINFQSREAYRAAVQAFVDAQQDNFYQVGRALTALDLLTEEERQAATLRIHLSVQDLRAQPAEDLPTISFRPPVEWACAF